MPLARSLARSLRDFMRFHDAHDLVIERSDPAGFDAALLREL